MRTKEIALIVSFATVLVSVAYLVQHLRATTGVIGLGFFFTILGAIPNSVAMLSFRGRRWRFFCMGCIVFFLILPTYVYGAPFNLATKWIYIANVFLCDLIFNTLYKPFRRHRMLWTVLLMCFFYVNINLLGLVRLYLFAQEKIRLYAVAFYLRFLVPIFLPVAVVEAIIGAIIGYRTYMRVRHLVQV